MASNLLALLLLAVVVLACDSRRTDGAPVVEPTALDVRAEPSPAGAADTAPLGASFLEGQEGYVVWESNRDGDWRIWGRGLDRSPPRRLTPDEPGRQHCCPHVSPDGRRLAYLSLPDGDEKYPRQRPAVGELRLVELDPERLEATAERTLVAAARTYFEHRAVVWRDASRLIYIEGGGHTAELDLATGASRRLTATPSERVNGGWLIDPTLRHATTGAPTFSRYDAERRAVVPRRVLGGCQPYFSHDGRWGFWVAGAGGPLHRIELASGAIGEIVAKNDPRIPGSQGYMYFPMLSSDGMRFAFAASAGEHDHMTGNYDVFVAESDPETLELVSPPVRYTSHAATDRYPDVHSPPLPLGRHFGEAPFTVELDGGEGDWSWRVDDGETVAGGPRFTATFDAAGDHRVTATQGDKVLRGLVRVRPAAPPRVVRIEAFERELRVHFDEPVGGEPRARLRSGVAIVATRLAADARTVVLELGAALTGADVLELAGVVDRAQRPNALPTTALPIDPPDWPSRRDGLVFLWRTADSANAFDGPQGPRSRASQLVAEGRAWLDRHHAMRLAGGAFYADSPSADLVLERAKLHNTVSVEATVTPDAPSRHRAGLVAFAAPHRGRLNLLLAQRGERLVVALTTSGRKTNAGDELDLGPLPTGRPSHVVVSYRPGRLLAVVDGEVRLDSEEVVGGFFPWRRMPLVLGNEARAERAFRGTIEGVAIYDRFVDAEEARENHRRYAAAVAARQPVAVRQTRGELVARSRIPTLQDIAPYTQALAVFAYRVAGEDEPVRVVHRVLVGGEMLPVTRREIGGAHRLALEPFASHPELESLYLSETIPGDPAVPLWFDPAIE